MKTKTTQATEEPKDDYVVRVTGTIKKGQDNMPKMHFFDFLEALTRNNFKSELEKIIENKLKNSA